MSTPEDPKAEIREQLDIIDDASTKLRGLVDKLKVLVPVEEEPDDPPVERPSTTLDSNHPALVYTGNWETGTGEGKQGGSDRYTADLDDELEFRFRGTRVQLIGSKAPHHGTADVFVDEGQDHELYREIDQKAATRQDQVVFYDSGELLAGEHTVSVVVAGQGVVSLDSVNIWGEPIVPDKPTPAPTPGPTPVGAMPWITRQGDNLLRDGKPWWFVGYNSFVLTANCGHPHEKMDEAAVDRMLDQHMRKDGHGMLRVFFYRGWNLARLDHLIKACKRNNVYILLTLDDAIGGCGASNKNEAWFRDQNAVNNYRNNMEMMLKRYRDEPTIAMWEWFNEPKWYNGLYLGFVNALSPSARQLDPNHLWCSGTMPPYSLGGNDNFRRLNESPGIDVASIHEYDLTQAPSNHFPASMANRAGKPLIVGEFSAHGNDRHAMVKRKLDSYIKVPGCCGALFWAWYGDQHKTGEYKTSHTEGNLISTIKGYNP